jgi:hypothetical protein
MGAPDRNLQQDAVGLTRRPYYITFIVHFSSPLLFALFIIKRIFFATIFTEAASPAVTKKDLQGFNIRIKVSYPIYGWVLFKK